MSNLSWLKTKHLVTEHFLLKHSTEVGFCLQFLARVQQSFELYALQSCGCFANGYRIWRIHQTRVYDIMNLTCTLRKKGSKQVHKRFFSSTLCGFFVESLKVPEIAVECLKIFIGKKTLSLNLELFKCSSRSLTEEILDKTVSFRTGSETVIFIVHNLLQWWIYYTHANSYAIQRHWSHYSGKRAGLAPEFFPKFYPR